MDFKKATLFAFIGSLLMLIVSVLWTISNIGNWQYKVLDFIPSPLLNIVNVIGVALLAVFFYLLHNKQD